MKTKIALDDRTCRYFDIATKLSNMGKSAENCNVCDLLKKEEQMSLINKKPLFAVLAIVLSFCTIVAVYFSFQSKNSTDKNRFGNTAGNLMNGGLAAIQGDWVYFYNNNAPSNWASPFSEENSIQLYKRKLGGWFSKKVYNIAATHINVVGKEIFFTRDGNGIYSIDANGHLNMIDMGFPAELKQIIAEEDLIYAETNSGALYSISRTSKENKAIYEGSIYSVNLTDDYIYFASSDEQNSGINRMKKDGTEIETLLGTKPFNFIVDGDWIFFTFGIDGSMNIHKVKIGSSDTVKLVDDNVHSFNIYQDKVFYINSDDNNKIYCISKDGTNKVKINDDSSMNINIIRDWIYYENIDDHFKLYRIKTDGTKRQKAR